MISKSLGCVIVCAALTFSVATPTFADDTTTPATQPTHKKHHHPHVKKALHAHKKKSTTQPANQ